MFEAVEQQDLDAVQILLYQYSPEELDLNTPSSQGLTPLDIAVMTNNTPIAKLLLKAGGKESPHCEYTHTHTYGYTHTQTHPGTGSQPNTHKHTLNCPPHLSSIYMYSLAVLT